MKTRLRKGSLIRSGIMIVLGALLLITVNPVTAQAYSGANYGRTDVNSSKYFTFGSSWGFDVYSFVPSTTGTYTFYSYSKSQGDPYFYLVSPSYYSTVYNSLISNGCKNSTASNYCLRYNDDGGDGTTNFKLQYTCYAGQTYYCFITKYSTSTTTAYFNITGPQYWGVNLNKNGGSGGSNYYYNDWYGDHNQAWLYTNSSSGTNYITPPTRSGYTFMGYYSDPTGGSLYIANNGYIYSEARYYGNSWLYAHWAQNTYTLTLNNQGVSNTTQVISQDSYFPDTITPPSRTGYTFNGYFSSTNGGGTQYYNSSGKRNYSGTVNGHTTLYAYWTPTVYNITYAGMDGAQAGVNYPSTHTYGTATPISDPTKAEYTFMGWSIAGMTNRLKDVTLGATAYTGNIALTANWMKSTDVGIMDGDKLTANTETNRADLKRVFDNPVDETEKEKGVTSSEMSNNASVKLELSVAPVEEIGEVTEKIANVSNGDVVKFFEATVKKTVTSLEGAQTVTTLKEIPNTIAVEIALEPEQQGKSSYAVYRYHTYENKEDSGNPIGEVQEISSDASQTEHYEISEDGTKITVYTRMFSTFAVSTGSTTLGLTAGVPGDSNSTGVDVQGRVSQTGLEATYKLDVSWGKMAYVFTTAAEWDPYNHTWGSASYAWSSDSFDGTNNKITVTNHSNADVSADISFSRETDQLVNTEVTFHAANALESEEMSKIFIPRVEAEEAVAPEAFTYMYLSGTPDKMPGSTNAEEFTKVGVITLTFTGDASTGLTPKVS